MVRSECLNVWFLFLYSSSREPPGIQRQQEPSGAAGPAGGQTSAGGRGQAGQSREQETIPPHVSQLKPSPQDFRKTRSSKDQTVLFLFGKEGHSFPKSSQTRSRIRRCRASWEILLILLSVEIRAVVLALSVLDNCCCPSDVDTSASHTEA